MTKWEYKQVCFHPNNWYINKYERKGWEFEGKIYESINHYISTIGLQGWELVAINGEGVLTYYYFKRPIE